MKTIAPKPDHYKNVSDNVKYIEYRTDLMKTLINFSNNDNNNDNLFNDIIHSSDLKKLLFDASMIQYIDEMKGYPKIIITVLAKYLKNKKI